MLTKANSRSTVHRPAYLDYVGVKTFDAEGAVTGERRFLGLFTSAAYAESVLRVPVLRRKVREVLDASGFEPASHDGKNLLQLLETYPRDELFQISADELLPDRDVGARDAGAPADPAVPAPRRLRPLHVLPGLPAAGPLHDGRAAGHGGDPPRGLRRRRRSTTPRGCRSRCWPGCTSWCGSACGQPLPEVDPQALEARLVEATRGWSDDFDDALVDQCGEERAAVLQRRYADGFPEGYKEEFPARTAVADVRQIEGLTEDGAMALNLYTPLGAGPDERRFKVFSLGKPISLSEVLPVLQQLGVEVVDERPYTIERQEASPAYLYDFGLRADTGPLAAPGQRVPSAAQTARACSRARSPRSGRARPSPTASTPWCRAPG